MRVLVVDDDRDFLTLASSRLAALGATVDVRPNAVGIDRLVQATRLDLVVVDLSMPDVDGLTAIERLRAAGVACPVVVLTNLDAPHLETLARDAGATAYHRKDELDARGWDELLRLGVNG
ncbi:MAG: response regulator transcription factor [Actinomycetes bacterium]